MKPFRVSALLLATLLLASPVRADDHDRARAALEAGEIAPLARVLAVAERNFRGRMVEAELEEHGRTWVYELTLLTPGGTVLRLDYDAKDATLLRARGRGLLRWYKGDPETLLATMPPERREHMRRFEGEPPPKRHRGWISRLWGDGDEDRRHHHGWFGPLWDADPEE